MGKYPMGAGAVQCQRLEPIGAINSRAHAVEIECAMREEGIGDGVDVLPSQINDKLGAPPEKGRIEPIVFSVRALEPRHQLAGILEIRPPMESPSRSRLKLALSKRTRVADQDAGFGTGDSAETVVEHAVAAELQGGVLDMPERVGIRDDSRSPDSLLQVKRGDGVAGLMDCCISFAPVGNLFPSHCLHLYCW